MKFDGSPFSPALVAGLATALSVQAVEAERAAEWYLKMDLLVETLDSRGETTAISYNVSPLIGQLQGSSAVADAADVAAYSSALDAPAAIAMVRGGAWGEQAGEYFSDYRSRGEAQQDWVFTVYSALPGATATLSWRGAYVLQRGDDGQYSSALDTFNQVVEDLALVDLRSQTVVPALYGNGDRGQYSFTFYPGERERQFRWVLGEVSPEHLLFDNSALLEPPGDASDASGAPSDRAASPRDSSGRSAPGSGELRPPARVLPRGAAQ